MKSKILILCLAGVLLLFGLNVPGMSQQGTSAATPPVDSVDIAISYMTVYPGTDTAWLEVQMKNPMEVWGYSLYLMMSNSDAVRFCCDDTGGCVVAPGGVFDGCTCSDGGVSIWWNGDMPIPPSPNYQTLFRICVSTCCIPDTSTDRNASIYMFPGMGWVVDGDGQPVPIRYHQGGLTLWWSMPGDANGDSLVTVADVVFLVNYLYRGGSEPCMCEAADANGDCLINLGDLVYLLNYLFRNGLQPVPGCAHCWHEDCLPE